MNTQAAYSRERVELYRNGALQALQFASPCDDAELRDVYLSIARTWAELADKIERELRGSAPA
jgi:hypothetical protein